MVNVRGRDWENAFLMFINFFVLTLWVIHSMLDSNDRCVGYMIEEQTEILL
jgi:hypothetical protein